MSNANHDKAEADAQALHFRFMCDMIDAYGEWLDRWYSVEEVLDDQA